MKKRSLLMAKRSLAGLLNSSLRTGDHCPSSGWWFPEPAPETARFISEGSVMPTHQGLAVKWSRAVQDAPASTQ